MAAEDVGLAIAFLLALALWIWAWRRFDSKVLACTRDWGPPEEPCWTEQISTDGALNYGRTGCYHANLAEMEARARLGQFDTPY